jgi:two-component system LytT family response regulator
MKAILIDDEKHCREVLALLLDRHCPDVTVIASCADGPAALDAIQHETPDVIFLDIEMPGMNGFELLNHVEHATFDIIFTTAYNEYAIKAIKHSALDYLLKPIDKEELITAVQRVRDHREVRSADRITRLLDQLNERRHPRRIAAATLEGLIMVNPDDILYCESDSAYCKIIFNDQHTMLLSKTLKEVEESLSPDDFCRIHHRYVINLNAVRKYMKGEGGEVVLSNGVTLPVSRTRKHEFLKLLGKI